MRLAKQLILIVPITALLVACAATVTDPTDEEPQGEDSAPLTGQCAKNTAGICVGKPIDAAVNCAIAKGASVLSFYRSPAEQECVRRQNGCTDRCTGGAGCVRPTAGCTTSPHTHCHAVDLVNDGAPVSRAQLKACGLAKTTAPHANHYDLLDGVTPR